MAKQVSPTTTNNESADFLVQEGLYIGLPPDQFEVRERFEKTESDVNSVAQQQSAANDAQTALTNRALLQDTRPFL